MAPWYPQDNRANSTFLFPWKASQFSKVPANTSSSREPFQICLQPLWELALSFPAPEAVHFLSETHYVLWSQFCLTWSEALAIVFGSALAWDKIKHSFLPLL